MLTLIVLILCTHEHKGCLADPENPDNPENPEMRVGTLKTLNFTNFFQPNPENPENGLPTSSLKILL